VNTASRMESHGTPGEIQITRATYDLLKDEFVCRRRGAILVKGKGRMETWYLVGPRSDDRRTERGKESEAAGAHHQDPR
jgi:adenylate cyclase